MKKAANRVRVKKKEERDDVPFFLDWSLEIEGKKKKVVRLFSAFLHAPHP